MLKLLIFLLILCTGVSNASDIIELRELSLDMKQYSDGTQIPLVTDNGLNRQAGLGVNLHINMDVLRYLYWNNTVHTISDAIASGGPGSHRQIGLEYRLGVRLSKELSFGYYHYSQHVMDITYPGQRPHEDAFEIRLNLYKSRLQPESLL